MRNKFYIVLCGVFLFLLSGCYDRDLIESKDGEPLNPITGLTYAINGTNVNLSWTLPSSYPSDIIQPVSVVLYVYRNGTLVSTITVPDAATSYTYNSYSASNTYRIIVKVQGSVDTDDSNQSNLRLSPGVTVVF